MDELVFLKSIARMKLNSEDKIIITNFISKNKIDGYLLDKIINHRLQFLLYKHLNELNILDTISIYVKSSLISQFIYWQLRYEEYLNEIGNIINIFKENGVNYVLIKGVSLANSLYTENSMVYRKFNDIDILINKIDVSTVNNILCKQSFTQGYLDKNYNIMKASRDKIIYWSLNSHQEHEYIKKSFYAQYRPKATINIDINTTIFEGGKIEPQISTSILLNNKRYERISSEILGECLIYTYELLQLCYHFYKDTVYDIKKVEKQDYCLIKFCDLREYILKYHNLINWKEFITIINKYNLGDQVYYVLLLVSSFYCDLKINNILSEIEIHKQIYLPNWTDINI